MIRRLGKFETAAAYSGEYAVWNIVGVVGLDAAPPIEQLRQALDLIQERHPFTRVRLIQENGKHFFESGGVPPIPLDLRDRHGDTDWLQVVEEALNYKFDHAVGPLVKCALVKDATTNEGEIIVAAQHSVVDGCSVETLLHEIVALVSRIEAGAQIRDNESLPPLNPVEDAFPDDFQGTALMRKSSGYMARQMVDEVRYQARLRGKRKPPIQPEAKARIIPFQTSKETTEKIVQRTRQERVTLNSVVNAAVLLSVQKHLYGGEAMPFRYMSMADLRPYLTPAPEDCQIGCYISPLRYTIDVEAGEELWQLAGRINEQIYKSSKQGEKYLASVMADKFLKMTFMLKRFRMSTTAISYGGTLARELATDGPYKMRFLRGYVSNFGMGPEFSGRVGLYDDALVWDMIYMDVDMDAAGANVIADEIDAILTSAV